MTEQEKYEQLMASRAALRAELEDGGVEDLSDDAGEGVGYDAIRQARLQEGAPGADPSQSQGKISAAGDTVAAGGAAGGSPYVAGAGLALKTIGMADDAKRQQEQQKIDAYNKKIMAQRSAIRNIFA